MAGPSKPLATLRPELATFEQLDMEMNRRGYIGLQLLPAFQVSSASATFGVIKLASLLANANADTRRTSTGGYNRGEYEFEDRSYQTKENGWEEPLDEREKNMYASFFDHEAMAALRAWEHVLNSLENRIIKATLGATVTAGQTTNRAAVWTDFVNSKPIDDVSNAAEKIWLRTGIWPNTLAISKRAWRNLRRSEQVRNEVMAQGAGEQAYARKLSLSQVAEVLDVDQIIVADAIKNSANKGQPAAIASMFPETQALLTRTATSGDFKEPCIGRTFHWGGDGSQIQGENLVGVVERYREEQTRKDIVRVRHETSEFILYPEAAEVITSIR